MKWLRYAAVAVLLASFCGPMDGVAFARWIDPAPPSVRDSYAKGMSYWSGPDGWMQEYDSPGGCSRAKSCAENGCETHSTRFAWADPREEPTWPPNLVDCECGGVGFRGDPRWVTCRYSE